MIEKKKKIRRLIEEMLSVKVKVLAARSLKGWSWWMKINYAVKQIERQKLEKSFNMRKKGWEKVLGTLHKCYFMYFKWLKEKLLNFEETINFFLSKNTTFLSFHEIFQLEFHSSQSFSI